MQTHKKGQVAALKGDTTKKHVAVPKTDTTTAPTSKPEVREKTKKSIRDVQEGYKEKMEQKRAELEPEIRREVKKEARPVINLAVRGRLKLTKEQEVSNVRRMWLDEGVSGLKDKVAYKSHAMMLGGYQPTIEELKEIHVDMMRTFFAAGYVVSEFNKKPSRNFNPQARIQRMKSWLAGQKRAVVEIIYGKPRS
jgi:hypothetical protein